MTTKTELFAELNDKENRVNATAHIAVYKDGNGNTSVIVRQHGAPNIWLSNHKSDTTTAAAVAKYTTWLNEWVAAQAETAQVRADLMAEIEADHAEGEAVVAAINNDIAAGIAHAEALEVNAAFDQAVRQSEVFPDIETYDHLCTSRSVECIRMMLLKMNRYNARFIVKMMIAVAWNSKKARIAAKARYQEMLERCAKATTDQIASEIPF